MRTSNKFNTIVLHRVIDGKALDFIDIDLKSLKFILSKSEFNFFSIEKAYADKHHERPNICLTFDDGFSSDYDLVLPELKKIDAAATFFIVTDLLDTPGYLETWQVKSLSESGMQIGSHSKSHPNFLELNAGERMEELHDSKVILEKIIGKEVTTFSFPFGFYDDDCAEAVFSAGYSICCTSKHGVSSNASFIVPRNSINAKTSIKRIEKTLHSGFLQRLSWRFEDIIKGTLKRSVPKIYIILRNLFSRA
ncbi:polysaccharide deacetylase family protein [Pseudomonadales bacterium]|nr:polysaccharide deacetylase family protein [Pseudomonadales bacterium]